MFVQPLPKKAPEFHKPLKKKMRMISLRSSYKFSRLFLQTLDMEASKASVQNLNVEANSHRTPDSEASSASRKFHKAHCLKNFEWKKQELSP